MASITLEEFHAFHVVDRELFTRLVVNFHRDPAESLLVMSLWLWLEDKGHPSIVTKMLSLPQPIANKIVDEAILCLKYLESRNPPNILPLSGGLPLTSSLMEREISLQMFTHNKFTAISGIKRFLNNVCALIYADILEAILGRKGSSMHESSLDEHENPLVVPGFPHPVFGDVEIIPRPTNFSLQTGELWRWDHHTNDVPEDDRTMFLTFSRGFVVTGEEVREVFTRLYGDCVESILMEDLTPPEQPLYARMVMRSVTTIDAILAGKPISKFRINGKHIWARKYEKRDAPV